MKLPVEEPPSTHSEPEEPVSPAHVPSPSRDKARKKSSKPPKPLKPPKPPKMPKAPKPLKVPKVKEGGKKKSKKTKELSPPPKPSSFAALESHAKDILSKMDQPKKTKVSTNFKIIVIFLNHSWKLWFLTSCQPFCITPCHFITVMVFAAAADFIYLFISLFDRLLRMSWVCQRRKC